MAEDIRKGAGMAWGGEEFPPIPDEDVPDALPSKERIEEIQANAEDARRDERTLEAERQGGVPPERDLVWSQISHCNAEALRLLLFRQFGQDQRALHGKTVEQLRDRYVALLLENGHHIEGLPEAYNRALAEAPSRMQRGDLQEGMEVMIFPDGDDTKKNFICLTANGVILKIKRGCRVPIPMSHFDVLQNAVKGVLPTSTAEGEEFKPQYMPRFTHQVFGGCLFDRNFNIVKHHSLVRAR